MADVRALLKAKRTERGTVTKPQKASLGRSAREHPHTLAQSKRKLDNEASQEVTVLPNSTRDEKRRKVEENIITSQPPPPVPSSSSSGFPSDFFSDPSRAPHPGSDPDDEDDLPVAQGPSTSSKLTVDAEFEAFERAIAAASKPVPHPSDQATFARATVFADPELVEEVPEGFPESVMDHGLGGRSQPIPPPSGPGPAGGREQDTVTTEEESEIEKRKRREQDERELIMDRLVDEERAQEEADARVNALKSRLEAIKKKREVVRAEKAKQKQPR